MVLSTDGLHYLNCIAGVALCNAENDSEGSLGEGILERKDFSGRVKKGVSTNLFVNIVFQGGYRSHYMNLAELHK